VRELCASSGILTRPMCIYRECQKPEFADLPVCVEDRKRWEKRDRERAALLPRLRNGFLFPAMQQLPKSKACWKHANFV
jgi:hypothetical protein